MNMGMAEKVDVPVILVADIDRGGVFASIYGTLALLEPAEKARVKGVIINKFRGDVSLLTSGLRQIEELTGVPIIGVMPWIEVQLEDEDGVALQKGNIAIRMKTCWILPSFKLPTFPILLTLMRSMRSLMFACAMCPTTMN